MEQKNVDENFFFYEFRSIFHTTHVKNAFFLLILASTTLHPASVWMHVPAGHVPSLSWAREDKGVREGILRTHPIPQLIRLELFLRPQIPRGTRQQPIT